MPLPIILDAYRCSLNWVNGGQHAVNVLHLLKSGSTAAATATALDANATALMWDAVQNAAVVTSVAVTPLDGSSATYILATGGAKWTGRTAGDWIPQLAQLVSMRTAFRGARRRGRLYLPFIGEASQSNGVIAPTSIANSQPAWNAWMAALIAGGWQPIVASYKFSSQVPVTSLILEAESATQRRRQTRNR